MLLKLDKKHKIKLILLLALANLNLFMMRENSIQINGDINKNIIASIENVSLSEVLLTSKQLSIAYNQVDDFCLREDLSQYDVFDKVEFEINQNELIAKIYNQNEVIIANCATGANYKSLQKGDKKQKSTSISIDGFLWSELLNKYNFDIDLACLVQDLLLNYDDISNRPIKGILKVLYTEIEHNGKKSFTISALDFKKQGRKRISIFNDEVNGIIRYYDDRFRYLSGYTNRAPVKFGIITSWYDKERIHPVTGINKPHFGTDYAATEGDPIYAVQSGIIEKIEFKRNNGNYVKIKHANGISSQYLHMSRFKKNLAKGHFVHKNDIIGYVGMTGLATAPHVCYRFWKNGRQINHLQYKDKLKKMSKAKIQSIDENMKLLSQQLNNI